MPSLRGKLRGDFDERLGLQFGGVRHHPGRDAAAMQFGQAIGGEDVGIARVLRRVQRVAGPGPQLRRRIDLLRIERVGDGALHRLVMRRQRPVLQPRGHEQQAPAVGLHDERRVAAQRVHAVRMPAPVGAHLGRLAQRRSPACRGRSSARARRPTTPCACARTRAARRDRPRRDCRGCGDCQARRMPSPGDCPDRRARPAGASASDCRQRREIPRCTSSRRRPCCRRPSAPGSSPPARGRPRV